MTSKDSNFPSPYEKQLGFRESTKYDQHLQEAARHFLNWAYTRLFRDEPLHTPLSGIERRSFQRVVEYAAQSSIPQGQERRLYTARYCTPTYIQAWQTNELQRYDSYSHNSVTGEHPFTKQNTREKCLELVRDYVGIVFRENKEGEHKLMQLLNKEQYAVKRLKTILCKGATTVLALRGDEAQIIGGVFNRSAWLGFNPINEERDDVPRTKLVGWERYTRCPGPGLWDRETQQWVKPWRNSCISP